jgi:5-methylcytosine-specific restriction endonuclease McrA
MVAAHVGLYGSVAIVRAYCSSCRTHAFVIDGLVQCCDSPVDASPKTVKRMAAAEGVRRGPSASFRREQLERQEHRCIYCECDLSAGSTVARVAKSGRLRRVRLRVEWDHLVPFSYCHANPDENFLAACQVCNGIKGSQMFGTLDEAQAAIRLRREAKGYV